ncbi:Monocarboxylate transporter [Wickerhamomyces ciferrii]|uniref:Monocarboxylate transporter n=1 Tax=Wickerhamomyces ciferrii (strain ATCC 14091 / BCRC 22168 / CBS 111 / JCM 3599 / NBRC 0793 / NRRL Y-1031 F-60-10) TaxID=1206466 RepID=K0KQB5_WICCF|nr:Monocarboxylate transporter [Wickerhamomyces ciferrii]CCH45236.1 Monocarboxylate transporter [Wickerhamomyces ciferrii]
MVNNLNSNSNNNESSSSFSSYEDEQSLNPILLNQKTNDKDEFQPNQHLKGKDSESITSRTTRNRSSSFKRPTSLISKSSSRKSIHNESIEELDKVLTKNFELGDSVQLDETFQPPINSNHSNIFKEYNQDDDDDNKYNKDLELGRPTSKIEKIFTNKSTGEIDLPPDGGYGWVCVACVVSIQACTWGSNAGFGVFLQYYLDNDVFPGATHMDFAIIAGIILFCAQFLAPLAMICMKLFGLRVIMSVACCVHLIGYILASFATKIWHLYVCQGFIVGSSYSFLFVPANIVLPSWFLKKRGTAAGICFGGTGLGGVIFSVGVNATIKKTETQVWALRMVGIVTCFLTTLSIIFIKPRIPLPKESLTIENVKKKFKKMFDPKILKHQALWSVSIWFALCLMGYNMVIFSYSTYATTMGLSPDQASTLTALINAAQIFGRPFLGFIADRYVGRVTYPMVLDIVLAILIMGFWINAKTYISLLFCALLLGFNIGVSSVMSAVLIADSFTLEEYISGWAIMNMILAFFSLPVEVMALGLRDNSISNPFLYTQIFGGLLFIAAIFVLLPQREWQVKLSYERQRKQFIKDLENIDVDHNIVENYNAGAVFERRDDNIKELKKDLENSINDCDEILKKDIKHYFKRLFYPMKI